MDLKLQCSSWVLEHSFFLTIIGLMHRSAGICFLHFDLMTYTPPFEGVSNHENQVKNISLMQAVVL